MGSETTISARRNDQNQPALKAHEAKPENAAAKSITPMILILRPADLISSLGKERGTPRRMVAGASDTSGTRINPGNNSNSCEGSCFAIQMRNPVRTKDGTARK